MDPLYGVEKKDDTPQTCRSISFKIYKDVASAGGNEMMAGLDESIETAGHLAAVQGMRTIAGWLKLASKQRDAFGVPVAGDPTCLYLDASILTGTDVGWCGGGVFDSRCES